MSNQYKHGGRVPNEVLAKRLDELTAAVVARMNGDDAAFEREFSCRIPAELDRDPDLVMSTAAKRLREACTIPQFPTHLRKMWSGSEVQAWLDRRYSDDSRPTMDDIRKLGTPPTGCSLLPLALQALRNRCYQDAISIIESLVADVPRPDTGKEFCTDKNGRVVAEGLCAECAETDGHREGCPHIDIDEPLPEIYEAYKTWPADIRAKLSLYDLRRMSGLQGEKL